MAEEIWLRCPQERSLRDEHGNPMPCHFEWAYRGRHPNVANCPQCTYKVPIDACRIPVRAAPTSTPQSMKQQNNGACSVLAAHAARRRRPAVWHNTTTTSTSGLLTSQRVRRWKSDGRGIAA